MGNRTAFDVIREIVGLINELSLLALLGAVISWLAWGHNARSKTALTRTLERTKFDYDRFVRLPLRRKFLHKKACFKKRQELQTKHRSRQKRRTAPLGTKKEEMKIIYNA